MTYTVDYFIERRKIRWNEHHDIEKDLVFRETVANEIISHSEYIEQIKSRPERMIELFFVVVNKEQKTVPFFLNIVQKDFIGKLNRAIEDYNTGKIFEITLLVLKGRQQGFTTLITAYQLASTITNKNFQGFTVADESTNTETIFQNKAKFPYDHLPDCLKPTEKYNSKRELFFEKINSSWSVDTATKNMGRSRTINFFHGSECAFWKDGISITQAGMGEAFTKNCIKIYESTANGFNDFEKMWSSGRCINCFYEWWQTPEYKIEIKDITLRNNFIYNIKTKEDWIFTRLRWLRQEKKLDITQLFWYYNKYNNYIDKELIKQEYPCTPEEAFLSTGDCYFDKEKIIQRLMTVPKPVKVGYFTYTEKSKRDDSGQEYITITDRKWVDDPNGFIKIYETPLSRFPYVLGGDTAGDGSDFFTAQVINNITGKQVAKLKKLYNEAEYAKQIYCLGRYYNDALIGVETNYGTYTIIKLEELKYSNLYIRDKEDDYTNKLEKKFGFKTTVITRPLILAELQRIVIEDIEKIVDEDTLREMLKFIKNNKGRPEAEVGEHDDLVMALAIVYYIRTQQTFKLLSIEEIKKEKRDDFKINNTYTPYNDDCFYDDVTVI